MRFGLNLNAQIEKTTAKAQASDLLDQARHAADHGFGLITSGQHFLTEPVGMFQPLPLLSAVAHEIPDIDIATSIILGPLEHPVRLAETIATMDWLTAGRVTLGMGVGYRRVEFEAFGVDDRIQTYASVVGVVRDLLAGEEVTAQGSWGRIKAARLSLPPKQKPRPNIWLAGNNDRGVELAARLGDAWIMNPHAKISTLAHQLARYQEMRRATGATAGPQPLMRELCIAPSSTMAREVAESFLGAKYESYVAWGQDDAQPERDTLDRPIEELVEERFIVGNPDECIEQIEHIREVLDPSDLIVRVQWSGSPHDFAMKAIELTGRHLVPYFAG